MTVELVQCVAFKGDGSRCEVDWALSDEGLCAAHDPARRAARMLGPERSAETRRARAERKRTAPEGLPDGQPQTLEDCVVWSGWVSRAVATGRIDNRAAEVIVRALTALLSSIEKRDLEGELHRVKGELRRLIAGRSK